MPVYRSAGRAADAPKIPHLSTRALAAPLAGGALCVVAAIVPPIALNHLLAPWLVPSGASLVPIFDDAEDTIMAAMLASFVVVLVVVWRRVRPLWQALWLPAKVAYVAGLLAAQLALVSGAEYALFESRGGLKLFSPRLESTVIGPGGRVAFVYATGGLACGWDVQTAAPLSPIMRPALSVSRASCFEPVPTVDFEADGTVDLLDAEGKPLEPQPSPSFSFGFGC